MRQSGDACRGAESRAVRETAASPGRESSQRARDGGRRRTRRRGCMMQRRCDMRRYCTQRRVHSKLQRAILKSEVGNDICTVSGQSVARDGAGCDWLARPCVVEAATSDRAHISGFSRQEPVRSGRCDLRRDGLRQTLAHLPHRHIIISSYHRTAYNVQRTADSGQQAFSRSPIRAAVYLGLGSPG